MLNYPLNLTFKIVAFNPQLKITDQTGQTVRYVKQKALALKEAVKVFADDAQQQLLHEIKADRIIDFSANYTITSMGGATVGTIRRQGMRSMWKATYEIADATGSQVGLIHEENPWIKVADGIAGQLPFVGMFINPAYLIDLRGQTALYLKKQPAVFEGKFTLDKRSDFPDADEGLLLSSVIMLLLLERSRG